MKSCLFLTLVVTTLIFQQSLADIRSDFSIELKDSLVSDFSQESRLAEAIFSTISKVEIPKDIHLQT